MVSSGIVCVFPLVRCQFVSRCRRVLASVVRSPGKKNQVIERAAQSFWSTSCQRFQREKNCSGANGTVVEGLRHLWRKGGVEGRRVDWIQ